jgi:formiminotetrahydrofolate cyclodeaminase
MAGAPDYAELRFGELLETIGARTPAPGGGSVAALVTAMAAALAQMAGRFSLDHWAGAPDAVLRAERLCGRASPLAREDAEAYAAALEAMRAPRGDDQAERDRRVAEALGRAAEVPLEIAELAAEIAVLAADVAEHGNPNLRGDAAAGARLAQGAAEVAAHLVEINLTTSPGDERLARARTAVDRARGAAGRASRDWV